MSKLCIVILGFFTTSCILNAILAGALPTRDKVQSLATLCGILNYGEFTHDVSTHRLNDPNNPIKTYQTGHNGRIEYVRAEITPASIGKGSAPSDRARKYARSMGKSNDDAGHIIANILGGTGKEFRIENNIRQTVVGSGQTVEVVVQLYYATPTDTRPTHFMYRANNGNSCHTADVHNP
ncbi:unnamed protein product [Adineta ricciae]|uniref:Uncharacterized protein n=1 Tax=Adineta ricciae TaxID=249248 RepID=A0A814YFP6_ADIRI|nr:unnamed protein product [Adineta ricciae]CAF1228371.1 unnamed protein product [Adineta ricciae]